MKYKILALDVDGTLLNSKHAISKRTLNTLKKAQQMGLHIVLVSGRPTIGLTTIATQLDLAIYGGYILSYNGAEIIDLKNKKHLQEKRINTQLLPFLEKEVIQNDFDIFTYHKNKIITNNIHNKHIQKEAKLNGMEVVEAKDFVNSLNFQPCKIMIVSDHQEALTTLEDKLQKRLNGTLDVYRSEDYFLEVTSLHVNKGEALSTLLSQLKINPQEVLAIGEGACDVPMLQIAGLGIAMENARDNVKICSNLITASNDNDGVAIAVEEQIISKVRIKDIPLEVLNKRSESTLIGNLGIQYTYAAEGRVEATMPVDHRTRQSFGVLHGGATLALAETVAGIGSLLICKPDELAVGMQVSGNHISSALEGDTVRAVGTILHKGRSSHVWNVDVFTSTNQLVSSVRVINSVLRRR